MDYCTAFFEGWWSHCCQAHDSDYLARIGKALADERLLQCVASAGDGGLIGVVSVGVAGVMWLGVRIFGRRWYRKAGEGK